MSCHASFSSIGLLEREGRPQNVTTSSLSSLHLKAREHEPKYIGTCCHRPTRDDHHPNHSRTDFQLELQSQFFFIYFPPPLSKAKDFTMLDTESRVYTVHRHVANRWCVMNGPHLLVWLCGQVIRRTKSVNLHLNEFFSFTRTPFTPSYNHFNNESNEGQLRSGSSLDSKRRVYDDDRGRFPNRFLALWLTLLFYRSCCHREGRGSRENSDDQVVSEIRNSIQPNWIL